MIPPGLPLAIGGRVGEVELVPVTGCQCVLEILRPSISLPVVSTLVLNLDDRLERKLAALAARSRQPLPDWAAEQLGKLAGEAGTEPAAGYSAEWKAAFGSIGDPRFAAPARTVPSAVKPLDAE